MKTTTAKLQRPWNSLAGRGLGCIIALMLAGCATKQPGFRPSSSTISSPLVVDVYEIQRTPESDMVVTMFWPERFGKEVQSVALRDLNLDQAKVTAIPGGRWATNYQVEIPTIGQGKTVRVETWPQYETDLYDQPSKEVFQGEEVTFYSPDRQAAHHSIQILKLWQNARPGST